MSLHYLGKHEPQKLGLFKLYCLENVTVLACYIFVYHEPILMNEWFYSVLQLKAGLKQ